MIPNTNDALPVGDSERIWKLGHVAVLAGLLLGWGVACGESDGPKSSEQDAAPDDPYARQAGTGTDAAASPGPGGEPATPQSRADAAAVGTDAALSPGPGGEPPLAAADLNVEVAPQSPILCPGDCVSIAAEAEGGTPPYAFSWDHGLPAVAGPHPVCPEATQTYRVTVHDSGSQGEEFAISARTVQGQVTIVVRDDCVDAGAGAGGLGGGSGDSGHSADAGNSADAGVPPSVPTKAAACSAIIDADDEHYSHRVKVTAVAAAEDVFVAGYFYGTVDLGSGPMTNQSINSDGFLARLDANCQPIWGEQYGYDHDRSSSVAAHAVAVDRDRNVVIGGKFAGHIGIDGAHHETPMIVNPMRPSSTPATNLFLAKVDGDGNRIWSKTWYQLTPSGIDQFISRISFDGANNILLCGFAAGATDFGAGPIAADAWSDSTAFLAKLDPNGNYLWHRVLELQEPTATMEPAGGMVVAGYDIEPISWGTQVYGATANSYDFIGRLNAQGMPVWGSVREREIPYVYPNRSPFRMSIDAAGRIYRTVISAASGYTYALGLVRSDPLGGADRISNTFAEVPSDGESYSDLQVLREPVIDVNRESTVFVAGTYDDSARINGRVLPSQGGQDVYIMQFDPEGQATWLATWGTEERDFSPIVSANAEGGVYVVGNIHRLDQGGFFVLRY